MDNIGTTHWNSGKEAKFLRWKKQILSVVETSIDRRYFITTRKKSKLHGFADAYECTMCAVDLVRSQPCGSDETFFTTTFRTVSSSHGNEVQKPIVNKNDMMINNCSF